MSAGADGAGVLDFERFEVVTFDCYGTLIDWESGITRAMGEVFAAHGVAAPPPAVVLERFARLESTIQAGPFRTYRRVLEEVVDGFGREFGFTPEPRSRSAFAASVSDWTPFPDTVAGLRALASRYRLAVVSNVDDDLFRGSERQLGIDFDVVVTAQQVKSYKPARRHFDVAFDRLSVDRDRIVHVAQSLFHDIAPANELGLATVWVNRRRGAEGHGATAPTEATPNLEVPDLASFAALVEQAFGP